MKKKLKNKKRLLIGLGLIVLLLGSTGFAGFMGSVRFQGTVATASIDFEVVEYSGTWVYKDPLTGERIISDHVIDDPDFLYVASGYAMEGTSGYDVDFVFDNIYPCIFFKADFVVHYIGSIPVHLVDIVFDADPWLLPYISWKAYTCEKVDDVFVKGDQVCVGFQLHYCMYLYVDVIVKLPQDNDLQDLNGYFSGELCVLQWDDFCHKIVNLPEQEITMVAHYPGVESYFEITLSGVPVGYDVSDGVYWGWCIDQGTNMPLNTPLPCTLYSSYDPIMQSLYPDDDWDLVNYLINHKHPDASKGDIQSAIWYFIDSGGYPVDPEAISMVEDAISNGEGFVPGVGEWLCVYVLNGYQQVFIEVDP